VQARRLSRRPPDRLPGLRRAAVAARRRGRRARGAVQARL